MKFKPTSIAAVVGISALALSGCSTTGVRLAELQDEIRMKDEEIRKQEEQNAQLRTSLAEMNQQPSTRATARGEGAAGGGDLLPPNAKTGECYARVWVEPSYRELSEQVLVREQSERVEIIPAKYQWAEETVLVSEASSRLETIPAVFGTEKERIMVKAAERLWRVGLEPNAAPASRELIATAKAHGIDLDGAEPGMCFHEHYVPAQYQTEQQQVLVSEATEKVETSPPKYRTVEKQVLVKEASFRIEEIPAEYKWVEEKVLDKPAHTVWKKGTGPIQRIDEATGEIMCLVEVPATYKTIRKRVLVTPASTRKVEIPAEYKTVTVRELVQEAGEAKRTVPAVYKTVAITKQMTEPKFEWHEVHNREHPATTRTGQKICLTEQPAQYRTLSRQVVKTPATTRKVEIPAEYRSVKVRKLVESAQEKRITIPAEYKTVTRRELAQDGHMEWRSILCETNMTPGRITQIQGALHKAGYDPGPIDGHIGARTMTAVNAFQRAKGLPVDRYLNLETLKALNVSPR